MHRHHGIHAKACCYILPDARSIGVERITPSLSGRIITGCGIHREQGRTRPRELDRASVTSGRQLGFARVVTDRVSPACLASVLVVPAARGQELSKKLVAFVPAHPDLQRVCRFLLATYVMRTDSARTARIRAAGRGRTLHRRNDRRALPR